MKKILALLALIATAGLGTAAFSLAEFDADEQEATDFAWSHLDDAAFATSFTDPNSQVPTDEEAAAEGKKIVTITLENAFTAVDTYSEPVIDPTAMAFFAADSMSAVGEKGADGLPLGPTTPLVTFSYGHQIAPEQGVIVTADSGPTDNVGVAQSSGMATAQGALKAWAFTIGGASTAASFDSSNADAWSFSASMSDYDGEADTPDL